MCYTYSINKFLSFHKREDRHQSKLDATYYMINSGKIFQKEKSIDIEKWLMVSGCLKKRQYYISFEMIKYVDIRQ